MATINHQQKITTCLCFDKNAETAVDFYISVFKNSEKGKVAYYGEGTPMPKGTVLTVMFQIEGHEFLALNAGSDFKFTEAISLVANCKTQNEIDYYWEKLSDGGEKGDCGWLKDKFGVSWQVTPEIISEMLTDENAEKSTRVLQAVMKMKKLDLKTLEQAYSGAQQAMPLVAA